MSHGTALAPAASADQGERLAAIFRRLAGEVPSENLGGVVKVFAEWLGPVEGFRLGLVEWTVRAGYQKGAHDFLSEMAGRLMKLETLTPNMEAALTRWRDRDAERAARIAEEAKTARPVPTGDGITLTGEVTRVEYSEYGFWKMTIRGDGWTAEGSVPAALRRATGNGPTGLEGRRVTLRANVTVSREREWVGYWKQPRAASLIG